MRRNLRQLMALACTAWLGWFASSTSAQIVVSASYAELHLPGNLPQNWFGSALANAGDVNRNGRSELIIGAPVSDTDSPNRPGSARIHDALNGALIWHFIGDQNGDKFGTSVAGIGDINGDGHAEVLIGAPGHDAGGADAGQAYIYDGATGKRIRTITGEAAGDWFGFSVCRLGFIDQDAIPDYAIAARSPSNGRLGYAYLYSGADGSLIRFHQGEASAQHFGYAVVGGGDMNNDGTPDVLVSAPFHPAAGFFGGRVYAYSGSNGALLHTFTGEGQSNFFGISIAIVGDVNGDYHDDILIGADANSAGGTQAGRAYVYSGATGLLLYSITGQEIRGRLGRSVSAAGDVNGNGFSDVMIGQPAPSVAGGSGTGRVFIFDGSTQQLIMTFVATEVGDFFGFTCLGGTDLTGDQRLDFAIGAFASNISGTQSGRVDVFHSPHQPAAPGDITGDGVVNVNDLLAVINQWGRCPLPPSPCAADISPPPAGDGVVNVNDLLMVINNWG